MQQMAHFEKQKIKELAKAIYSNGVFAVQNAEAGHEKAITKYQILSQKAYDDLLTYLDSL
jgi:hypothetical protein